MNRRQAPPRTQPHTNAGTHGAHRARVALLLALLAVALLVGSACSGTDDEGSAATGARGDAVTAVDPAIDTAQPADAVATGDGTSSGDDRFVVGVVMPTARDDRGFSQSMIDALAILAADGMIDEVIVRDKVVLDEDADALIREFAATDTDLIIGHGPQYGGLIAQLARERPDLDFAWGYGDQTFDLMNVTAYNADSGQGGYVLGQVAAHLVGQGSVALIGPNQVGDDRRFIEGFFTGVAVTGLEMDVSELYTDSYVDIEVAAGRAREAVQNEADVLGSTSPISAGVIPVAREAGLPYFGNQVDNADLAPDTVVASQVYRWDALIGPLIDSLKAGGSGGAVLQLTLDNNGLVIEYNPAYELSADVRAVGVAAAIDAAAGGIDFSVGG